MPGFWKRPITRMYHYNLDFGELYYNPLTSYLDAERGTRGETPGALTYSERLARQGFPGRRSRAMSEFRTMGSYLDLADHSGLYLGNELERRAERARSEARSVMASTEDLSFVSAFANREKLLGSRMQSEVAKAKMSQQEYQQSLLQERRSMSRQISKSLASTEQACSAADSARCSSIASRRRIDDDICKKVADIHMMPWSKGLEYDQALSATARSRARIIDLEKELEEITKKAMSTHVHAAQTARQMAQKAQLEDEAAIASSYKKSKKVMIESSSKVN